MEENSLQGAIARALAAPQANGAAIREAFETAPAPDAVKAELLAAYRRLGQGPVAVRSSATAEDLPGATFAGQQDTYLNVSGEAELLEAVRRCWASLWTDRAISYRERQGVGQEGVRLAVVVQRMVPAQVAGVMFSANPVTGARDEVVIDAAPGLGEAVVSGLTTPDHFVLKRQRLGWRVILQQEGRREVAVRALASGGTETVRDPEAGAGPTLTRGALLRLSRTGEKIQRLFGRPQDIEWAWADGQLFILQARPMTALPDPPPRFNRLQRLLLSNFVEMLPVRPYPLDLDTWLPGLGSAVEPVFDLLGFRWDFGVLLQVEDGIVLTYRPHLPRPTWRTLTTPLRLISNLRRYNPLHWQADALLEGAYARTRELEERDPSSLSWQELLEDLRAAREIPFLAAGEIRRRYFPGAAFAALRLGLLLAVLGRSRHLGVLLSGVENKTLEMNGALEALAGHIRAQPALAALFAAQPPEALHTALQETAEGRDLLSRLDGFLARFGHRETVISTSLLPTWKDAPEMVLGLLKSFSAHAPAPVPQQQEAWQAAREEVLLSPLLKFSPLRAAFLGLLTRARAVVQIREDTHFYATLAMPIIRRRCLELGRRLVQAGVLETPEEVYHLMLEELAGVRGFPLTPAQASTLQETASRRNALRAGLEGRPLVDPRSLPQPAAAAGALLSGIAGSPGTAEGPARVILSSADFDKLGLGEILVAPYTNPSWTPLFGRAAAVVVDSGSPASHAAIVAREYGIPAVMGTINGTQVLRNGERVRVDGSRGLVSKV